jgi:septum formation protein
MGELILASGSAARQNMLMNAGIQFRAITAKIDERSVEEPLLAAEMHPADIAEVLAIAKAAAVSAANTDAWVIGSDQTLSFEGTLLHKPENMEAARRRLLNFSGKTHHLHTAVVIVRNEELHWSHVETAKIKFRDLSPAFVGRYMAETGEVALSSVGAYQIEGRGIKLFEEISGDFFAIMGLPLLPLLKQLRELEIIDS